MYPYRKKKNHFDCDLESGIHCILKRKLTSMITGLHGSSRSFDNRKWMFEKRLGFSISSDSQHRSFFLPEPTLNVGPAISTMHQSKAVLIRYSSQNLNHTKQIRTEDTFAVRNFNEGWLLSDAHCANCHLVIHQTTPWLVFANGRFSV